MKTRSLGLIALLITAVSLLAGLFLAPRETLTVLAPVAIVAAAVTVVANTSRQSRPGALVSAINTLPANIGTSKNSRRYLASAAVATRYLLGKIGADEDHIAVVAATADQPIGLISDEAAAAEDPVNVELLGVSNRTLVMVAGEAIDEGENVYATAAGKVQDEPAVAGTYWQVGVAATPAAADGDPIEVIPCKPERLVVVAELTAPDTANGSDAATTQALANALKADLITLQTALATPAKLKLLNT